MNGILRLLQATTTVRCQQGFLLPSVIFISFGIMILSVASFSIIASSSVDQNNQYYRSLAKQAAESGAKAALGCVASSVTTWPAPLAPNTDCNGAVSGTDGVDYVAANDNWKSTYQVSSPTQVSGKTTIISTGTLKLYDGVNNVATITETSKASIVSTGNISSIATLAGTVSSPTMGTGASGDNGRSTSYAITEDGKIYAWGFGFNGTLGIGSGAPAIAYSPVAVDMTAFGSEKAVSITILAGTTSRPGNGASGSDGYNTIYAVSDAGKIYAWGFGFNGTLGIGSGAPAIAYSPVAVDMTAMGASKVVSVVALAGNVASSGSSGVTASGRNTIYALTEDGKIYAWGFGFNGTLGVGSGAPAITYSPVPVDMTAFGSEKAVSITTLAGTTSRPGASSGVTNYGRNTIYAVSDAGKMYAWGWGYGGALGVGAGAPTTADAPVAVDMSGMGGRKAKLIVALAGTVASPSMGTSGSGSDGRSTLYTLTEDGKIYAWGYGTSGTLGVGSGAPTIAYSPIPVDMTAFGAEKVTSLTTLAGTVSKSGTGSAGSDGRNTIYAVSDAGKIYAWGYGFNGTLGVGSGAPTIAYSPIPVDMSGMGGKRTKLVMAVGGDIGSGGTSSSTDYGRSTVYALTEDGKIYAWGFGFNGTLGVGSGAPAIVNSPIAVDMSIFGSEKATRVLGLSGTASKPGASTTSSSNYGRVTLYAVSDAGKVYAWGFGFNGTLGIGSGAPAIAYSLVATDLSGVNSSSGALSARLDFY